MLKVNAMGDACPIPVVKTKQAIRELNGSGEVEVLVDNEIAVQNLTKMAKQKGYAIRSSKLEEGKFQVNLVIADENPEVSGNAGNDGHGEETENSEETICIPDQRKRTVVVISSNQMGHGDEVLGKMLMKGFIFALTQQDALPGTILFYNGGAFLTCEESASLEDLRLLESQGVEILTCGTCLNHYGLADKLKIGGVTNMYEITEKMMQAESIVKP
ncbi:MAG: sulfurtransferase-like selenium metabolism protein YedF [Clostridiales bacterium]|nr:sulfurtransferase-like selenium metabolism protein YedF [Clostridiales bacterium]